jgi:ribonuclease HII
MKISDQERYALLNDYENQARQAGYQAIAGVDEAGRGPLAGPVAAAAVILDPDRPILD